MERKKTQKEDGCATNLSRPFPPGRRVAFQIRGIQQVHDAVFIEHLLQQLPGVRQVRVDALTGRGELVCSQVPSLEEAQHTLHRYGYMLFPQHHASPAPLPSADSSFARTRVLFRVEGIHCACCVLVIERRLKKLEGVQEVHVDQGTGHGTLICSRVPSLTEAQNLLRANGYTLFPRRETSRPSAQVSGYTPSTPLSPPELTTIAFQVKGMHCASCEVVIEQRLHELAGVQAVRINARTGTGEMLCTRVPSVQEAQHALQAYGYTILPPSEIPCPTPEAPERPRKTFREYLEIVAIMVFLIGSYQVFTHFNVLPAGPDLANPASYGAIFLIGLVASVSSCMGAAGGLLVGIVTTVRSPQAGVQPGRWQTLQPTLLFHLGRMLSYTVFGAAIGTLGSIMTLSPLANSIAVLLGGLVLLLLGLRLLGFLSWLHLLQPRMPAFLRARMQSARGTSSGIASFLLGAGTFFLPCGFTQALQLYVLSKGSPIIGALTMLIFALGTLPALLSFGALSSLVKGGVLRVFVRISAVMVLLIGLVTLSSGFALLGLPLSPSPVWSALFHQQPPMSQAPLAPLVNGKQVVSMQIKGMEYLPSMFTVRQSVPVEWQVDGSQAQGCAHVLAVPDLGLTVSLPQHGSKTIVFVPKRTGNLRFSCPMALTTPDAMFMIVAAQSHPGVMSYGEQHQAQVDEVAAVALPVAADKRG
jgi:uncharacterized protein